MRIVIPVKPFVEAKQRLAPAMGAAARARLASDLFRHVFGVAVEFAGAASLMVVSRSSEILQYAKANGAGGLSEGPDPDLNAALERAAAHARAEGVASLLVVASDLPLLRVHDLALLAENHCAIAPDIRGRGTNALLWPLEPATVFDFGEDSFARHCAAARHCGWEPAVVVSPGLGHDIDIPDDLIGRLRPVARPRSERSDGEA